MPKKNYIIFDNSLDATKFYEEIKKEGIKATLAPTPKEIEKCCGVTILFEDEKEIEKIKKLAERKALKYKKIYTIVQDINPNRLKFS